ncbi:unnamed protein product [Cylindrotheca closterium]|uniref:Uncharacterized protein n=1 Tax=Cylindrotheca closterium TaxID=2856 RepID=A0AAD2JH46_9STRA|nr:unnamed protein product [Cylindrotheca closterium]
MERYFQKRVAPCGANLNASLRNGCIRLEFPTKQMQRAALKLDGSLIGNGRRISLQKWIANEKVISHEDDNNFPKRNRPTYAVVVKNLNPTNKILFDLECYFANRIGLDRNDLHASRMKSGQKILLELPSRQKQEAALRLDGSLMGSHTMEVQEWRGGGLPKNRENESSVTDKQESDPLKEDLGSSSDVGDGDSLLSSPSKSLSLKPTENKDNESTRKKKQDASSEIFGEPLESVQSPSPVEIESKDRLQSAANEHIKVLSAANSKYEKRIADQFSKIEELQAQLKNYQLQERSPRKEQLGRNECPNDMSESRLTTLCHEKDAQLRNRQSEIIALKASLRDAVAARNRQEQAIRVQNTNTMERLNNLKEKKDAEIKSYVSNVQSLETKLKEAATLNHQKEQMINILNHNVKMADEQIRNLQNGMGNTRDEELLRMQYRKKDFELKGLKKQVILLKQDLVDTIALKDDATMQCKRKDHDIDILTKQVVRLKQNLADTVRRKDDAQAKFEKRIAEERTWNAQLEGQLSRKTPLSPGKIALTGKLSPQGNEVDLSKRLEILKKDKVESIRKLKIVQTEKEEMQRELEDARKDVDDISRLLQDKEENLRRELRLMEDDMEGYRRDLKAAEKVIDELYNRLKKKDEDMQANKIKVVRQRAQISSLQVKLKQRDQSLESLKETIRKMKEEMTLNKDPDNKYHTTTKVEPTPRQQDATVTELEAKLFNVIQDQNVLLAENQSLRRDKQDMQRTISTIEANNEEENEQLREEIEQMKMNQAMELGLMEGSDLSEEVASLKEELEKAYRRMEEMEKNGLNGNATT